MAANLDKAESSLTAVSDIAYIRGIDGSGNSVRISKADLASVLGGIKKGQDLAVDVNTLDETCIYSFSGGSSASSLNLPTGYCILLHLKTGGYYPYIQICFGYNAAEMWTRAKEPSSGGAWYAWHKVEYSA